MARLIADWRLVKNLNKSVAEKTFEEYADKAKINGVTVTKWAVGDGRMPSTIADARMKKSCNEF